MNMSKDKNLSEHSQDSEKKSKNNRYEEIKKHLLTRYHEILHRVDRMEKDARRKEEPLEIDLEDQAISLENNDVMDRLNMMEREELNQIFDSLSRLETGQYGRCLNCGEIISEKRLKALPYTQTCIDCAKDIQTRQ